MTDDTNIIKKLLKNLITNTIGKTPPKSKEGIIVNS